MKQHSSNFKTEIKKFGREIDSKISLILDEETIELGAEVLNSITPHYEAKLLKSVMKQIDIDSNINIPVGTEINYQFGLKVGSQYEYLDFGNYIVYSSEKQEDSRSYKIVAYDKMLNAMKDYSSVNVTYPVTIRDYIDELCNDLGLTFKNSEEEFVNYDKTIPYELFLDADGNSLNYTYRDVLDQLAEVTAGVICINSDDELEIRYINETNDVIDEEYLKDINVNFGEIYGPINSVVLSRSAESDNIYQNDPTSIEENGLCEIKISENQIMNFNNRDEYLQDIFQELNGIEYCLNDFSSTGIIYYDLLDKFTVEVDNNSYDCLMLNNEIDVTQGLEEKIFTKEDENSKTDYSKSDKTDRRINQAISMVDKQNLLITNLVSQTTQSQQLTEERLLELTEITNSVQSTLSSTNQTIEVMQKEIVNGRETLQNSLVTIDINGINVSTNSSAISTLMTNDKFIIKSGETTLAYFGYDDEINSTKAEMDNLTVTNYLVAGYHRIEKFEINGEKRTGFFYIGG